MAGDRDLLFFGDDGTLRAVVGERGHARFYVDARLHVNGRSAPGAV